MVKKVDKQGEWKKWVLIVIVILGAYFLYQKQHALVTCRDDSDCPPSYACNNGVCAPLTPFPK